jgi:hypothetical protein
VTPFRLHFQRSRRQRLASELPQWLPAIAGSLGFGLGAAFLSYTVSPVFLLLLLLPPLLYRGLFVLLIDLLCNPRQTVVIDVTDTAFVVRSPDPQPQRDLAGIFQVFRSGTVWTVLHLDGSATAIPADAITDEQVQFLKSFALRAAAERRPRTG